MSAQRGRDAEDFACAYLLKHGLRLLERNFHCRWGEIDLIMQQQGCIVFVEVRYRSNFNYGSAIESVSLKKQQRLVYTAYYFLQQRPRATHLDYRFDIIGINAQHQVEWVENAFEVGEYGCI